MSNVAVTLSGVFPVGPEHFLCAVLLWEEGRRIIPVWLSPLGGAQLLGRISEWEPTRPDTHSVLMGIIEQSTSGVSAVELVSYYNGVFVGQIVMEDGAEIDCRPSDALVIALALDLPIEVDEMVLNQASVRLSQEDAADYFDIEFAEDATTEKSSASGDAQADADFLKLMRDLGVEEKDLGFADSVSPGDSVENEGSGVRPDDTGVTEGDSVSKDDEEEK